VVAFSGYQVVGPSDVAALLVLEEIWLGSKVLATSTRDAVSSTYAWCALPMSKVARPMKSTLSCGCWITAAAG